MPDIFIPSRKKITDDTSKSPQGQPQSHTPNIKNTLNQTREIDENIPNQSNDAYPSLAVSNQNLNNKMAFLTSVCKYPEGIKFVNQEQNEKIIIFVRQHFITNLRWIIPSIIAFLAPPIVGFIINILQIDLISASNEIIITFILFYYLLLIGYVFTSFLHWFFNIGIVTEKRMIDIDYSNILHKNIASVHIAEVIDTEIIQLGFLQGHFNYGDILIQTVGIKPNFEFLATPQPHHVSDIIHDLMIKVKKRI